MSRFACGECCQAYDRKYGPRYVSASETAYAINLGKTCTLCGEIKTQMEICLACALESNQCQNCRSAMFGVRADLLSSVGKLRMIFHQSIAKHRSAFESAISGFRDEVENFLAESKQAQERMEADLRGLDARAGQQRYRQYMEAVRDLPFAHRPEYEQAKRELELHLQADEKIFAALVEYTQQTLSVRSKMIFAVGDAVSSRLPSYLNAEPPEAIETQLSLYANSQMTEAETKEVDERRERSYQFGKSIFEQMSGRLLDASRTLVKDGQT